MTEYERVGWVERSETHRNPDASESFLYAFPRGSVGTWYPGARNSGFTLLELLVVITLLSIVAGAVVIGYEDVQDQGREDMVRFEMAEIRKALLQFRRDSGTRDFPGQGIYDCSSTSMETIAKNNDPAGVDTWPSGAPSADSDISAWQAWCAHPANFWMLFVNPLDDVTTADEENGWNEDTRRGWNGPYLQRKSGVVAVDADYNPDGSVSENGTLINNLWGIASPYITQPSGNGDMTWQQQVGGFTYEKFGTPYFLFDLDDASARVLSLGANHDYDDAGGADDCLPPLDATTGEPLDNVVCLLR